MLLILKELSTNYGNKGDNGFTFVSNNGPNAHQTVMHMHWHFASGTKLEFTELDDPLKKFRIKA